MPIGYSQAGSEVHEAALQIMQEHHKDLKLSDDTWPTLCLMFVHGEDKEGEAPLKLHGYPCAAVVSVIPVKQRADKRADAEILIDEKWWEKANERQRTALLDHEITHLEIASRTIHCCSRASYQSDLMTGSPDNLQSSQRPAVGTTRHLSAL